MKIIFTILLIFFGFFTNNVFAEDIDLKNLTPAKPCPSPYQPGECYNDPNYPYNPDGSPKPPKTEGPIKNPLQPAQPCPSPYKAGECYNDPNYPYNPDGSPKIPEAPKIPGPTRPGETLPEDETAKNIVLTFENYEGEGSEKVIKLKDGEENWDRLFNSYGFIYRTQLSNKNTILIDHKFNIFNVTMGLIKQFNSYSESNGQQLNIFEYKDLVLFIKGPNYNNLKYQNPMLYILHKKNMKFLRISLDLHYFKYNGLYNFYLNHHNSEDKELNKLQFLYYGKGDFLILLDNKNFSKGDLFFKVPLDILNDNYNYFDSDVHLYPMFKDNVLNDFSFLEYQNFVENNLNTYLDKEEKFFDFGVSVEASFGESNQRIEDLPFNYIYIPKKSSNIFANLKKYFYNLNDFLKLENNSFGYIKDDSILYIDKGNIGYYIVNENGNIERRYLNQFLEDYSNLNLYYNSYDKNYYVSSVLKNDNISSIFYGKTNYVTLNGKLTDYEFNTNENYYYLGNVDGYKRVILREGGNNFMDQYLYKENTQGVIFLSEEREGIFLNFTTGGDLYKYKEPILKKGEYKNFKIEYNNPTNDGGGEQGENGGAVTGNSIKEKEKEKEKEKAEFEKLKQSKEQQQKKLEEGKQEFSEKFGFLETVGLLVKVLNFEINVNSYKNFNIPILRPVLENGKLKVDYEKVNTNLKPIDDNLNIAKNTINSDNQIGKDFLSVIFVVLYVFFRILVIGLIFIFSIFVYKIINTIVDYILPGISNDGTSGNVFSFLAYMSFLIVFSVLVYSLFSLSDNFLLLFNNIINFLDSIFVFFLESFFNLDLFLQILKIFNLGLYGCIVLFVLYKLALKFGRLF